MITEGSLSKGEYKYYRHWKPLGVEDGISKRSGGRIRNIVRVLVRRRFSFYVLKRS